MNKVLRIGKEIDGIAKQARAAMKEHNETGSRASWEAYKKLMKEYYRLADLQLEAVAEDLAN